MFVEAVKTHGVGGQGIVFTNGDDGHGALGVCGVRAVPGLTLVGSEDGVVVRKGHHVGLYAHGDSGEKLQRTIILAGKQGHDTVCRIVLSLNSHGQLLAIRRNGHGGHVAVGEAIGADRGLEVALSAAQVRHGVTVQRTIQVHGNKLALDAADGVGVTVHRVVLHDLQAAAVSVHGAGVIAPCQFQLQGTDPVVVTLHTVITGHNGSVGGLGGSTVDIAHLALAVTGSVGSHIYIVHRDRRLFPHNESKRAVIISFQRLLLGNFGSWTVSSGHRVDLLVAVFQRDSIALVVDGPIADLVGFGQVVGQEIVGSGFRCANDQVGAIGGDGTAEIQDLVVIDQSIGVQIDICAGGIVQFDKAVGNGRLALSAAAVYLIDNDMVY